jgi:hypothetical protein
VGQFATSFLLFLERSGDFAKLIAEETEKWSNVIRAAKIKPG